MQASNRERGAAWCFAWAGVHSALFVLMFTFPWMWFLSFAYVLPVVRLAEGARSTRMALVATLVCQTIAWTWLERWMREVTAAGWPALAAYLAAYQVLFVWVMRRVLKSAWGGRLPTVLVLPIAWTGLEFLRSEVVMQGYPWFLSAHPLTAVPAFVQSADLFGASLIVFLSQMAAGVTVDVMRGRSKAQNTKHKAQKVGSGAADSGNRGGEFKQRAVMSCAAVAVVYAGALGYGFWRMGEQWPLHPGLKVLAIQTNLPQSNKTGWSIETQEADLKRFIEQTEEAFAQSGGDADVVIWPETMAPGPGFEAKTLELLGRFGADAKQLRSWPGKIVEEAKKLGRPMLVGSSTWADAEIKHDDKSEFLDVGKRFNSAVLVWGDGPYSRYDKVVLTPFGETMPYISKWKWLEERLLALGAAGMKFDLNSAERVERVEIPLVSDGGSVTVGTPICFEDTVGYLCREMVWEGSEKRAKALINISNDGWFGEYDGERRHHVECAKLRCVENRVPLVRCVNTGESVVVDSCGREAAHPTAGARQAGWLEAQVNYDDRQTLYGRVGDVWGWGCAMGVFLLTAGTFFVKRKQEQQ